jgi:hypothetical protein
VKNSKITQQSLKPDKIKTDLESIEFFLLIFVEDFTKFKNNILPDKN